MLKKNTAKLECLTSELVTEGVVLRSINLAADDINAPFEASCFEVLPGCATLVDYHDVRECWMIAQGSGVLDYAGEKTRVQKQDILYFQPQKKHQITNDSTETLIIYSLYW